MTADDGDERPAGDDRDERIDGGPEESPGEGSEESVEEGPEESPGADSEEPVGEGPEESVGGPNPRPVSDRSGTRGSPSRPNGPPRGPAGRDDGPDGIRGIVHTLRTAGGTIGVVREVLSTAALVLLIGGLLFAVSGVWPPMVAIKSGSMEPHMSQGDLVFIVDDERLAADGSVDGTGVVPHDVATETGHQKFGDDGDVIVFRPDNRTNTDPIIHRAKFYVEEGENWYPRADESLVDADDCEELRNCPAPNEGFITKGDANTYYDQPQEMSGPVDPEWIQGKAMVRIPALGWIRLWWGDLQHGAVAVGAIGAVLLRTTVGAPRVWPT